MLTAEVRYLVLALATLAAPALAGSPVGFPQGTWILDEAASRPLAATSQALEVISDDGQTLSFTLRKTDETKSAKALSWSGAYGGAPHLIEGSSIMFCVAYGPNGSIVISGSLAEGGKFQEKCHVAPSRRRFRCDGTLWSDGGKKRTYVEIYDLRR